MKKILSIIIIFIIFIFIYFLQANFFNWFTISGVKANLFIILSLFMGIFIGRTYGGILGVIFGLFLDLFIGKVLGLNAIILGMAGVLGGIFTNRFSKDSRITIMLMVAVATLICEIVSYTIQIIVFSLSIEIISFVKIIFIETLYNTMLIIILYPIIVKAGTLLEKIFTEDKILTRYY